MNVFQPCLTALESFPGAQPSVQTLGYCRVVPTGLRASHPGRRGNLLTAATKIRFDEMRRRNPEGVEAQVALTTQGSRFAPTLGFEPQRRWR